LEQQPAMHFTLAEQARLHSWSFRSQAGALIGHCALTLQPQWPPPALATHAFPKGPLVQSLQAVAGAWRDRGDVKRSYEVLAEAHGLAQEIGDRLEQANILTRMGEALARLGRDPEASDHLAQASELAQAFGDRLLQSEAARLLAEVYAQMGDLKAARSEARRALELAEKVGSPPSAGMAHRVLGSILAKGGITDEDKALAEQHLQKSIEILGDVGHELELGRSYQSYADILSERGDADGAATFSERATEITERLGPKTPPLFEG